MEGKVFTVLCLTGIVGVRGHGMLWDPPNRSSLWRFGYDVPVNYDDNQNYCGGFNGPASGKFKCGICGDDYEDPVPRDNEYGGLYGLGIITRIYEVGGTIPAVVDLETEHKGYFQFHICNMDEREESEECFRTLRYEDGSTRHYVRGSRIYNLSLQLPEGFQCEHCVLRWHYRTGNSWGLCKNGTGALGCGPQETFRNCADISFLTSKVPEEPRKTNFLPRVPEGFSVAPLEVPEKKIKLPVWVKVNDDETQNENLKSFKGKIEKDDPPKVRQVGKGWEPLTLLLETGQLGIPVKS